MSCRVRLCDPDVLRTFVGRSVPQDAAPTSVDDEGRAVPEDPALPRFLGERELWDRLAPRSLCVTATIVRVSATSSPPAGKGGSSDPSARPDGFGEPRRGAGGDPGASVATSCVAVPCGSASTSWALSSPDRLRGLVVSCSTTAIVIVSACCRINLYLRGRDTADNL